MKIQLVRYETKGPNDRAGRSPYFNYEVVMTDGADSTVLAAFDGHDAYWTVVLDAAQAYLKEKAEFFNIEPEPPRSMKMRIVQSQSWEETPWGGKSA